MASNNGEPSSAPQPERWYNLTLGASFKDQASVKFSTLRYEFKPASIDKSQAGSLHKNKENRVSVEFHNNQPGKPKVTFEGSSENYKDNDGVLFFDGQTFRLERLHRAVKRLRHVRLPGEAAAAAAASAATPMPAVAAMESRSPPLGKTTKSQPLTKAVAHSVPVEIEKIDIGEPESPVPKPTSRNNDYHSMPSNPFPFSPDPRSPEAEENVDIVADDDAGSPNQNDAGAHASGFGLDINIPGQNDSDEENADVDISDDEGNKGPNAAEALQAQMNAEEKQGQQTSSSSDSSGSGSSGSGSGSESSSSDSDGSDDDSASSGGDIDI
ncbi:EAF family protein [Dioscorea alata]|uniref:EAF family protein n=1 Tax=Dioscorea alata TaxID=55571 RepID=A0ACB7TT65_DIOAL|nr:EAF family protein [Dioscorea alata]